MGQPFPQTFLSRSSHLHPLCRIHDAPAKIAAVVRAFGASSSGRDFHLRSGVQLPQGLAAASVGRAIVGATG